MCDQTPSAILSALGPTVRVEPPILIGLALDEFERAVTELHDELLQQGENLDRETVARAFRRYLESVIDRILEEPVYHALDHRLPGWHGALARAPLGEVDHG